MKKKQLYLLAASVVLLIVFHVITFVLPFERTKGFWIEYVCSFIAIVLFLGVTAVFCVKDMPIKSKFLDWPVLNVSYVLLIVQLCIGFAVMALPVIPYQAALVVSVIVLAIGVVLICAIKPAVDEIERVGQRAASKVNYIQRIRTKAETMTMRVEDKALAGELKKLSETIRFSDPMSSGELYDLECGIENGIDKLNELLAASDYDAAFRKVREILQLLQERNLKCRMLK